MIAVRWNNHSSIDVEQGRLDLRGFFNTRCIIEQAIEEKENDQVARKRCRVYIQERKVYSEFCLLRLWQCLVCLMKTYNGSKYMTP